MKNISAWAIKNPIVPLVLFMVLGFVGLVSFVRLPINLEPDISFPMVIVSVSQPGAAPTELEKQILQKIEASVATVGNVHNITSRAYEGAARIFIEFQIGTPVDRAVNDVRDAVSRVRADLPEGIQEPTVSRVDTEGNAIVYYALSSTTMTDEQLSWFVDNSLSKRLLALSGVAQVSRGGGVQRQIRIDLDPAKMQALGITAVQVNQQLRTLNLDSPGGRADIGGGEQSIRVLGGAKTADQLAAARIELGNGRVALLSDVADVRDGVQEIRSVSKLNGQNATTVSVFRARGFSDVTVYDRIKREMDALQAENPGVHVTTVYTSVTDTMENYHSSVHALVEGSLLAVLVVWLFLREWRATAISALAIPLSAIPTFIFMQWMDFTLNSISLLALSLVAGVLVDDAIVEIENIMRHIRMGKSPYQAALDAADEIGLAVVATSATIIAVFLPVSFMSGITGQYFKQFGLTVAVAVFMSLLVARLITPVIAAFGLKPETHQEHLNGPWMQRYLRVLRWSIDHRRIILALGTGVFVFSLLGMALMSKTFQPDQDGDSSQVAIELPPGVRLEDTERVADQVAGVLKARPEVRDILESVGSDDDGNVRSANLTVVLKPLKERAISQKQFEREMLPKLRLIPDARIQFNNQGGGIGNGRDYTIYITGEDPERVEKAALTLVDQMREVKQIVDPRINGDMPRPEIVIKPRLDIAAEMGVTVQAIGQTVRIATIGDIQQNAAKFSLSDRQVPIIVALKESARTDIHTLENLPVPTLSGGSVPLKVVASIGFGQGPATVRRYNQSRRVMIDADFAPGVAYGDAQAKIEALPGLKHLPEGVHKVDVGQGEFMVELFTNFALAVGAGVLMVFAVLVLLFARFFQPITILSALPLALAGAVLALVIMGMPFSLPVVIGILMLMGIVGKNSILLVDFAIEEIRSGKDRVSALLEAGHKRAQPIIMTSVAMIAGMLPSALGVGEGAGFRQPMAVAVIGGIITSTGLTLVMVPAMFTVLDDFERWLAPKFQKLLGHSHHDNP